jgi:hypothetical protein
VDFRAPVPLPSAVTFTASAAGFVLRASATGRTHLVGELASG